MTNEIQKLKEDIAILQQKLQKLEAQQDVEIFRSGEVKILGINRKTYYRIFYTDSFYGVERWFERKDGILYPVDDINDYGPLEESYKKKYETIHIPSELWEYSFNEKEGEPTLEIVKKKYQPTPEETDQSLRESFKKAQQTEEWKETQKMIDEKENDKNFKNTMDLINEWGEKNKPPTLYQLIEDWWCDIFCAKSMDDMETCIDGLVNIIDTQFIPPSHDTNDYQWNKCLNAMRNKLR